jgi:hypothetical protein
VPWPLPPPKGTAVHPRDESPGLSRSALCKKARPLATFPLAQIKRVRLVKRADGYYVQFAVKADRQIIHKPTGKQIGIDVGLKFFSTDS